MVLLLLHVPYKAVGVYFFKKKLLCFVGMFKPARNPTTEQKLCMYM